jgi:nucleotidyltransferase/DNA polymerase involved in DNA repair
MENIEKTPHQKIQESAEDRMRKLGIVTVEEIKDFARNIKTFKGMEEHQDKFLDVLSGKLKELTPGQKQTLFRAIAEDLDKSYETSKDNPEKQEDLQKSLEILQELENKIFIEVPPEK